MRTKTVENYYNKTDFDMAKYENKGKDSRKELFLYFTIVTIFFFFMLFIFFKLSRIKIISLSGNKSIVVDSSIQKLSNAKVIMESEKTGYQTLTIKHIIVVDSKGREITITPDRIIGKIMD